MKTALRKMTRVLLAILLAAGVFGIEAFAAGSDGFQDYGECGEDLLWELNEDGSLVLTGSGDMNVDGDIPWEKYKSEITSLVLPEGLTGIAWNAFENCTHLTEVTIPDGVEEIRGSAFRGCTGLTSVTLPDGLISIGNWAFSGCSNLQTLQIPDTVSCIEQGAFSECAALSEITAPKDLSIIYRDVFDETAWYRAQPDGFLYWEKALLGYKGTAPDNTELSVPTGTILAIAAFEDCSGLTSVTVQSGVPVPYGAFRNCASLTSAVLEDGVPVVEAEAFSGCTNLTSIKLSGSLHALGNKALADTGWYRAQKDGCLYLDGVLIGYKGTMPANTTLKVKNGTRLIADYAFADETALTGLVLPDSVEKVGAYAFYGCSGIRNLTVSTETNTGCALDSFGECTGIETVTITGNGVLEAAYQAGYDEYGEPCLWICTPWGESSVLHRVVIQDGVTGIGEDAFYECNTLSEIILPKSVKTFGEDAFYDCYEMQIFCYKNSAAETYANENVLWAFYLDAPRVSISNASTGMKISWESVDWANRYFVYRKTGNGKWELLKKTTARSYTDTTVKSGTTYAYTVRGEADGIRTDYVGSKALKYLAQPKVAVSNTSKGAKVSWGKVKGAAGYYVYRKTGNGSWKRLKDTKGTSYTDTTAKSGTTYSYSVKAYSGSIKSTSTNSRKIKCLSQPSVKLSNTSKGVKISWGKVKGAAGYYVYRKTPGGKWTKLKTSTGTSYTDKTVKKGKTYYYTVKAYSGKTYSSYVTTKKIKRK